MTLDTFRGRSFLGALSELCPELVSSAPGTLHSANLPALHTVVAEQGGLATGVFSLADFVARGAAVGASELAAAQRAVRPDDICYILYTSGSTAASKGVTLAHGPLIANGFDIGERMHLTAADRVWLAVPLFWSFGAANALPAGYTTASLDALFARANRGRLIELPFVQGPVLYFRRECVSTVGGFDANPLGGDYGVEIDFCLRAGSAGFKHALAGDVFAYHEGHASFGREAPAFAVRAETALANPASSDITTWERLNELRSPNGNAKCLISRWNAASATALPIVISRCASATLRLASTG